MEYCLSFAKNRESDKAILEQPVLKVCQGKDKIILENSYYCVHDVRLVRN